jgi:hypothetical protein
VKELVANALCIRKDSLDFENFENSKDNRAHGEKVLGIKDEKFRN